MRWRHNGRDSVSNHQPCDSLLKRLFRSRSKKTSKLRVTGLYAGNSPVTGEFPAPWASNAENVSIWWRHYDVINSETCVKRMHLFMPMGNSLLTLNGFIYMIWVNNVKIRKIIHGLCNVWASQALSDVYRSCIPSHIYQVLPYLSGFKSCQQWGERHTCSVVCHAKYWAVDLDIKRFKASP